MRPVNVTVDARAAGGLALGHPWVFREAVRATRGSPKTGDPVAVVGPAGEALGAGLYDASSPIAVRVYHRDRKQPLDEKSLAEAITRAFTRRDRAFDPAVTDAYRLCHGEGDRVPGMVIDRYGDVAVVKTDGDAIAPWVDRVLPRLRPALESRGVRHAVVRVEAAANEKKFRAVWGAAPDTTLVRENDVAFEVDLAQGQKTGAFLDQRDNRARVRGLAKGKERVLNLFSYAGGFSLAAALGGAKRVVSVDSATRAHATAQRSFRANELDPRAHDFVTADAFQYLDDAAKRGDRFDLIVSDPPSFAPNEKSKKRALGAYGKLHGACARVLAPGGTLCASSCSSHIGAEEFLGTLDDRLLARSDLVVAGSFGPPADHPTLAAFPEGRYLKFVVLESGG